MIKFRKNIWEFANPNNFLRIANKIIPFFMILTIITLSIGDEFIEDCIGPPIGAYCDGNSIEVIEHAFEKPDIIHTVDIFGRTIDKNSNRNLQIRIYSNGLIEKKYFLSH